ncbi:MAG: ketosteroid isomerase-like protein [Planctomycetota bacterium]|jgi:ketosteroid isomerase-like protein
MNSASRLNGLSLMKTQPTFGLVGGGLLLGSLLLGSGCATHGDEPHHDLRQYTADEQAVLDTVQGFFDVLESKDAEAGAKLMVPDGVFVNLREKDGIRSISHFNNANWVAGLPKQTGSMWEAFSGDPVVLVEGNIAMVWGAYAFKVDGEPSHTGVDAFNLLRTADGWRISGGAYTVVRRSTVPEPKLRE